MCNMWQPCNMSFSALILWNSTKRAEQHVRLQRLHVLESLCEERSDRVQLHQRQVVQLQSNTKILNISIICRRDSFSFVLRDLMKAMEYLCSTFSGYNQLYTLAYVKCHYEITFLIGLWSQKADGVATYSANFTLKRGVQLQSDLSGGSIRTRV